MQAHLNFVDIDPVLGPIIISLVNLNGLYVIIIRSRDGQETLQIERKNLLNWKMKLLSTEPNLEQLLKSLGCRLKFEKLKWCPDPQLPNKLLELEESMLISKIIIGIVYPNDSESLFQEFLFWLTGSKKVTNKMILWESFHISINIYEPCKFKYSMPSMLLVYQCDQNHELIKRVMNTDANTLGIVTMEKELGAFSLEFALRKNIDTSTLHLPQPSIIKMNPDGKDFLFSIRKNNLTKL